MIERGDDGQSGFGVTIEDVARHAGVSKATVSRVLGPQNIVSAKTRERVTASIEALGYVPSRSAQALAGRDIGLVGLLLREPSNATYGKLHREIQEACRRHSLQLVTVVPSFGDGAERESQALRLLRSLRVSGLLVATGIISSSELSRSLGPVPLVAVGRPEDHPQIYGVSYDELANAAAVAAEILRAGHDRVAVLGRPLLGSVAEYLRTHTVAQRLRAGGAQVTLLESSRPGTDPARFAEIVDLARRREISAVVFANDERVVRFCDLAEQSGLRIPEDVSVIGFDGIMPGLGRMGLTTVRMPVEAVASRSVEIMASLIREPGTVEIRHELFPGEFVAGRMLGPPPSCATTAT